MFSPWVYSLKYSFFSSEARAYEMLMDKLIIQIVGDILYQLFCSV